MALVVKILQCLAIICAAVLFAGAFDVFQLGLKKMIEPFAIGPIALFFIFSLVGVFLGGGKKVVEASEESSETDEKMAEFQAKMNSRMAALQTTVDGFSGQDRDSLQEENQRLRDEIEAIKKAEQEKAEGHAEALRKRNEELEEQIKQWAIEAVGKTVADAAPSEKAA